MGKRKKALVIVESPAKAKKIGGFLGPDYIVRASIGHVRDLPEKAANIPEKYKKEPWSRLGINVEEDFAPLYVVPPEKKKVIKELKDLLKDADELILATDEDREGEAIGWHVAELLQPKVPVKRIVFSEITKKAIQEAMDNPRDLDTNLVEAQEARRILDRLYGYTLSPLLWKKIRPQLSAGRVQSVAVRVLVQRELERLAFKSGTYWDLKAELQTGKRETFTAQLATVDGQRIASGKDFDENTGKIKEGADVLLLEEDRAKALQEKIRDGDWQVTSIEHRQQSRKPAAPFTTSTLQQEANRKLNMSARQCMSTAQRLYEEGHITYMRTDSVTLSSEALTATHKRVKADYGDDYLVSRQYTGKTKNAQEAHEAIRPAGEEMRTAKELGLHGAEARLYEMIWKRTMASQMAEALLRFDTVTVTAGTAEFKATGRHVEFPGFFKVYVEGSDDPDAAHEDEESALPELAEGDKLDCTDLEAVPHETKPPARYTEASLVRRLEAEGVGRPSTYASIIGTITSESRGYARKVGSQLVPTFTAMAVTKMLEEHFTNLVDLQFTAQMEQSLDDISTGEAEKLPYLREFYLGKDGLEERVKAKEPPDAIDARSVCTIKIDGLGADVRVGKFGPFLSRDENGESVTAGLPPDLAPADIDSATAEKLIEEKKRGPVSLGMHEEAGLPVYVKRGPFGPYVQLGDATEEQPKPKRAGIPNNFDPDKLDLDTAVKLLELPRRIGHHPVDNKVVNAGMGRFGPYVLHAKKYGNFDKKTHTYTTDDGSKTVNVLTVDMDTALEMLSKSKSRGKAEPLKKLGEHPEDGAEVAIYDGKYGPYVKWGKVNATIPEGNEPANVSLEQALPWLEAKAARKGVKKKVAKKKTPATKKPSPKKKTAKKKSPAKKTAARKTKKKSS